MGRASAPSGQNREVSLMKAMLVREEAEERLVADAVGFGPNVLDCGCGSGRIARTLRGLEVDGIELSRTAAEMARAVCRRVVNGSVTDPAAWQELAGQRYDVIVFCHVLEHLTDPFAALALAGQYIESSGRFVIVLPNVAIWRLRWHLLTGRWEYADEGILDRTHVRFYTRKTARELLAAAGLRICEERLLGGPPGGNALRRWIVRAVRGLAATATSSAFLFVAKPSRG